MMRALESMCLKLKSTGIYTLSGNTLVDYELQSYAEGLDLVYDALMELEKESFTVTASDYGLSMREQQFKIAVNGEADERRTSILKLGAITPSDHTKFGIQDAMNTAGVFCEICENTTAEKLYVNCLEEGADTAARNSAKQIAKLFLPAHLNAELDFRSISWNNTDQTDETFDTKDTRDLTWDSIDNYENAMLQL
jgi:hypothetical protein